MHAGAACVTGGLSYRVPLKLVHINVTVICTEFNMCSKLAIIQKNYDNSVRRLCLKTKQTNLETTQVETFPGF